MERRNEKKKDKTNRKEENKNRKKLRGQPGISYEKAGASAILKETKREKKNKIKKPKKTYLPLGGSCINVERRGARR